MPASLRIGDAVSLGNWSGSLADIRRESVRGFFSDGKGGVAVGCGIAIPGSGVEVRGYVKNEAQTVNTGGCIEIRGARQNNLRGFDLRLPLGKWIVVTGPSGSGKSSLAFDTVYAEGQRRYVETFSPYTRQFLERMDKPQVDEILGIPPAIAIEQANPVKTSRSTVGTITEIADYLKLLLPRVAEGRCPKCGGVVRPETTGGIVSALLDGRVGVSEGETALLSFVVPVPVGADPVEFRGFLIGQGYLRVWIGGKAVRAEELTGDLGRELEVVQDRVEVREENRGRLMEAVEAALRMGKGRMRLRSGQRVWAFATGWHCAGCSVDLVPPSPGLFSFNHPAGACPKCRGFGRTIEIDLNRAVPDRGLSLEAGVVKPFQTENGQECQRDLIRSARKRGISVRTPFEKLSEADQRWVLEGERPGVSGEELWRDGEWYGVRGFFNWLESKSYKMHVRVLLSRYRNYAPCTECRGGRYQPGTLCYRFDGRTLPELMALPVGDLERVLRGGLFAQVSDPATGMLLEAVRSRLGYLREVGLEYLSLDRPTRTLSGGEVQRVNLTTCLGASLVNTLFVLDEPSVGLHPRDTQRLVGVLERLRDCGNTLLVVEHEEAVIRAADYLVELGPGRGIDGGGLEYAGHADGLLRGAKRTLTSEYLNGHKSVPVPEKRRKPSGFLTVRRARANNLKGEDVRVPLGVFACVTGVSGSGKSTLVHSVLYENLAVLKGQASGETPGLCDGIEGWEQVGQVLLVDQSPLSRTPRSSPAVYLGVFDDIRELFASTEGAAALGLKAGAFSFNAGTGRCERCSGSGFERVEMQFLSDVFVRCAECEGRRYQSHVLGVRLAGKRRALNVHEVLELSVTEALDFFDGIPGLRSDRIAGPLRVLAEVGLGYLKLGQPLNLLSGGESQRLKLVERLVQGRGDGSLLILDEPTTGLHLDDVAVLVRVLDRLVKEGNSLLVIEHHLDVIRCADYVLDIGPGAGESGGRVVAAGTPEEIARVPESETGRFLKRAGRAAQPEPTARVAEAAGFEPVITVSGAREHNLKNLSVRIPREELVVVTGRSGSGKSTLAFDLLFAEGQRRFLDSMSAYARQFVEQMEKPDVDGITGLPPTVAIEQRVTRGGGKSTVATVTEVYHFLRLLFAKVGVQHCPCCGSAVGRETMDAILQRARDLAKKGGVRILAPLVKGRKGYHTEVAAWAQREGFAELRVDGKWVRSDRFQRLERFQEHSLDVLVATIGASDLELRGALERALELGKGTAYLLDAKGRQSVVSTERSCVGCGLSFEELDPRLFSFNSPHGWCTGCHGFGEIWKHRVNPRLETEMERELDEERQHEALEAGEGVPCGECGGVRLNAEARAVRLGGTGIGEVVGGTAEAAVRWLEGLKFTGTQKQVAADILPEIRQRLEFLREVGLDYLALNRSAKTLSGGESQRIRLAAQLGSNLRGVLYVLDEPTIGLHPRDNGRLLDTLEALRAKGNSLVVVEHDEDTMRRANTVIDLGPGAGTHGGRVVAQGSLEEIQRNPDSVTGRFLREPMRHPLRGERRGLDGVEAWIELEGASKNNLKDLSVRIPVGRLTVISGVSGSGKSSLMRGVLKPAVEAALKSGGKTTGKLAKKPAGKKRRTGLSGPAVHGVEHLEAVYEVDQAPIGKTSRSTPATYIKVFDEIRAVFAQVPMARIRGYGPGRFSFNSEGGRCEACGGQGVVKVEMSFLPTSHAPCTECSGSRYEAGALEVRYNGRTIGEVLAMTVEDAADFFAALPRVGGPLQLLRDTGLGYLRLGQPSPTLSGGEAQRLKLVSELTKGVGRAGNARRSGRGSKSMLYLLEEPTIGLHLGDVQELLVVLHRLVDEGHTVVVIEHHLSVLAEADYILDIGPEAGPGGGELVASGPPETVANNDQSRTAPYLKQVLGIEPPKKARRNQARGEKSV